MFTASPLIFISSDGSMQLLCGILTVDASASVNAMRSFFSILMASYFEQYHYCCYYYHDIVIGQFAFILSCVGMCPKTYLTIYVYGQQQQRQQQQHKTHLCVHIGTCELPMWHGLWDGFKIVITERTKNFHKIK